ncbi:MAG TPA: hypothetical protein PKD07_18085 [Microthrixaceae bacterium]|nr:hypothetical protein [Microthrixaceae bacterium]
MKVDPRSPVVIGVGQVLSRDTEALTEPIELAVAAARAAAADAGVRSDPLRRVEAVAVTPIVSWRYRDPARLVADDLGLGPVATMTAAVGGNTPQMLMNRLAERITAGQLDLALLCGAESYRTRMAVRRSGTHLDWRKQDDETAPTWTDGEEFDLGHPVELTHGVLLPTQAYPLFENALRHGEGRSLDDHMDRLGQIWERFSAVAARNPHAWDRTAYTARQITEVTAENRIVGFPYTKHMVSNPNVDMASAAIVCSAATAAELGVATDRWVFLHGGSDAKDPFMSNRTSFVTSEAIRWGGPAALAAAGVGIDDLTRVDLYSCFPAAVEIAARELGIDPLDPGREPTVWGGLCFAGGPWNNPVGHAIAAMVEHLRSDGEGFGLVTANGGNIQKHSFGVYSPTPPRRPFTAATPAHDLAPEPVEVVEEWNGTADLETWTVMHGRDGSPEHAIAVARTREGSRAWATSGSAEVMARLEAGDLIGTPIEIRGDIFEL